MYSKCESDKPGSHALYSRKAGSRSVHVTSASIFQKLYPARQRICLPYTAMVPLNTTSRLILIMDVFSLEVGTEFVRII